MADKDLIREILDLARWAPSGDNTQPWRFEILAADRVAIHGHDTRDWCVYDFEGRASHIAHGALLETLRIAASAHGLDALWSRREGSPDIAPIYDVELKPVPGLAADPLLNNIRSRTVQRRRMATTPPPAALREALHAAVGDGYRLRLFESPVQRWRIAHLLWKSARVRLRAREAFEVHRRIIEWGATFSKDRIPERAVGVDSLTAQLMRWAMQDWRRVDVLNRFAFGTFAPRLMLDLFPGLACGAHLLLERNTPARTLTDHVDVGRVMQRLWLTVAAHGFHLQPQMTPLIFSWYGQADCPLSSDQAINRMMAASNAAFARELGERGVFFCRIGQTTAPVSRSIRLGLDELMY